VKSPFVRRRTIGRILATKVDWKTDNLQPLRLLSAVGGVERKKSVIRQEDDVLKSKLWKRIAWTFAALAAVVVLAGVSFSSFATPLRRETIQTPIYTIGDGNYSRALDDGKNIVKFGPLPLGLYTGGIAFDNQEDAWNHLREVGKQNDGWGVYRLSGDFDLDTYQTGARRYTDKSLLVIARSDRDGQSIGSPRRR
jgi:hypothetical protein